MMVIMMMVVVMVVVVMMMNAYYAYLSGQHVASPKCIPFWIFNCYIADDLDPVRIVPCCARWYGVCVCVVFMLCVRACVRACVHACVWKFSIS